MQSRIRVSYDSEGTASAEHTLRARLHWTLSGLGPVVAKSKPKQKVTSPNLVADVQSVDDSEGEQVASTKWKLLFFPKGHRLPEEGEEPQPSMGVELVEVRLKGKEGFQPLSDLPDFDRTFSIAVKANTGEPGSMSRSGWYVDDVPTYETVTSTRRVVACGAGVSLEALSRMEEVEWTVDIALAFSKGSSTFSWDVVRSKVGGAVNTLVEHSPLPALGEEEDSDGVHLDARRPQVDGTGSSVRTTLSEADTEHWRRLFDPVLSGASPLVSAFTTSSVDGVFLIAPQSLMHLALTSPPADLLTSALATNADLRKRRFQFVPKLVSEGAFWFNFLGHLDNVLRSCETAADLRMYLTTSLPNSDTKLVEEFVATVRRAVSGETASFGLPLSVVEDHLKYLEDLRMRTASWASDPATIRDEEIETIFTQVRQLAGHWTAKDADISQQLGTIETILSEL